MMRKKMSYKIPLLIKYARCKYDLNQYDLSRNQWNQLIMTHRDTGEEILLSFDETTCKIDEIAMSVRK